MRKRATPEEEKKLKAINKDYAETRDVLTRTLGQIVIAEDGERKATLEWFASSFADRLRELECLRSKIYKQINTRKMDIETVEDLCNDLADKLGVYGACKSEDCDGCDKDSPMCCRVGFMMLMPDRVRKAVENDKKLEAAQLK